MNLDLPNSERFRFQQLSHFLHSIWTTKPEPPQFTPYEQWCGQLLEQRRGISIIYLSLAMYGRKAPFMLEWEEDTQESWDLDSWHRAFFRSFKGILNISLIEASLKVITRWYMTPSRLSSMFPSVSPLCFRGCHMRGTMMHIWWDCPKIRGFWNKIFQIISKVMALTIPKFPLTDLLNQLIPKVPKFSQKLIFFILLGTKLTIANTLDAS